jgi:ankyrin repeat protein
MKRIGLLVLTIALPQTVQAQQGAMPPAATANVDYERDVKPILSQNCYGCHGAEVQQSGLRLDLRQNALRGGDYGPVIIAGHSADSKLIKRLVDGDGGMQMPPTGPLAPEEIAILRAWIDQGVEFKTTIAEEAAQPTDPRIAALVAAVRTQTADVVATLLEANPDATVVRDQAGSTLLHHAAGFGSGDTMRLLVDAGADVNAKNRRGSTPLHWAIHDEAKVRLLLAHGANVNATQTERRTPLYLASMLGNGLATVKLLLDSGADPGIATANGMTPLMAAAVRGDVQTMRLLVGAKAAVNAKNGAGETSLMFAATSGSPDAVEFLLDRGADARLRSKRNETALGNAGTAGVEAAVRLLLDHDAEVNVRNIRGYSPLMLAAGSDAVPTAVVRLLLARGADPTFTADYNESARDLAAKRGDTEVLRLLGGAPAKDDRPAAAASRSSDLTPVAEALSKALTLLEQQSGNFIRISGCNSCHSQDLPSAAAGYVRQRSGTAPAIPQLPASMMPSPERLMDFTVVSAPSTAWELVDAGMNGAPADAYTDAAVRFIKAMQRDDGSWSANESRRPPMNAGDFQAAAVCIYALKHYGPAAQRVNTEQAIANAVGWLQRATPETTQDHAFRALALAWAANESTDASKAVEPLYALQRADGGWSQFPGLESDAYATGQAVYALSVAGKGPGAEKAYHKGVEYLRRTQAADGSWHVRSRSIWLQPYLESGFPYGRDQFISTAGTAWAVMALATSIEPREHTQR